MRRPRARIATPTWRRAPSRERTTIRSCRSSHTAPTSTTARSATRTKRGTQPIIRAMNSADAFVFFGATGDLAYRKIFPALQALVKRGELHVPIIGVGRSASDADALRARARASLEAHGGVDPQAFETLSSLLQYVKGDYADPATFAALRAALGSAKHPLYYLAIPPELF